MALENLILLLIAGVLFAGVAVYWIREFFIKPQPQKQQKTSRKATPPQPRGKKVASKALEDWEQPTELHQHISIVDTYPAQPPS